MKKISLMYLAICAMIIAMAASCSDDDPKQLILQLPKADFDVKDFGNKIVLTDKSVNVVSYYWTFDDGATSTEQNPTHTYAEDGKYMVVLTVTGEKGKTHSASEEVKIGDGTNPNPSTEYPMVLDGNFDDWAAIPEASLAVATLDAEATDHVRLKQVKFYANKTHIYMYMKMDSKDANAMDLYLNVDGQLNNGYNGWMWKDLRADYLVQGFYADNYKMTIKPYNEEKGGGWGWLSEINNIGLLEMSPKKIVEGTIVEFEAKIDRALIPGLKKQVQIAVGHSGTAEDAWSTSGGLPTVPASGDKNEPLLVKLP